MIPCDRWLEMTYQGDLFFVWCGSEKAFERALDHTDPSILLIYQSYQNSRFNVDYMDFARIQVPHSHFYSDRSKRCYVMTYQGDLFVLRCGKKKAFEQALYHTDPSIFQFTKAIQGRSSMWGIRYFSVFGISVKFISPMAIFTLTSHDVGSAWDIERIFFVVARGNI